MYNLPEQERPQLLLQSHREETQGTDHFFTLIGFFCKTSEGSDWEKLSHISSNTSYKSAENPNWASTFTSWYMQKQVAYLWHFLEKVDVSLPWWASGVLHITYFIHSLTKASSLLLYIPQRTQTAGAVTCMVQSGVTLSNLRHSEDIKLRHSSEVPILSNRQRLR